MSLMTREDVLRELEFLPVWQLRAPLPSVQLMPVPSHAATDVTEVILEVAPLLSTMIEPVIEPVPPEIRHEEPAVLAMPFRLLISTDASIAFLLDSAPANTQDTETLLSNMLKAININCSIDIAEATRETLGEHAVKLLVVMGEAAAESLLGQLQAVADWRSARVANPIYYQQLPVVVTYHPTFLLNNTAYKAQAWVDLCAAKRMIEQISRSPDL